jgi:hypothetical protein
MEVPLRAVEGLQFSKIDEILIAFRELVDDSRIGTAGFKEPINL